MSVKTAPIVTSKQALSVQTVDIDGDCVGDRWIVQDIDHLATIIAIIAMGQAIHAAKIIEQLQSPKPTFTHAALTTQARLQLQISGKNEDQLKSSRWRRDGFIFEAISWLAAKQASGPLILLKDPHLKSTTQGIDGLMIELDASRLDVIRATICEDKCSKNPRSMFRDHVMAAFQDHHQNNRGPEVVATAAALLEKSGLEATAATLAASRVLDLAFRRYRAALTIDKADDTQSGRIALFKGYNDLDKIGSDQRIGATFVVDGALRQWFDLIAARTTDILDSWKSP